MRIDDVKAALGEIQQENLLQKDELIGCTAKHICEKTGLQRTAISEDLSKLVGDGQVIKIKSRPTLFFLRSGIEKHFEVRGLEDSYRSLADLKSAIQRVEEQRVQQQERLAKDPFATIVGHESSLKQVIKKLKAAVMYPPNGLNVMLTGASGVGKTLLAEQLHRYYQAETKTEVPFIYFNCAEYFNNPELLTSHLFGYKKGSFTGADGDRQGLVELADGGFFFLDEVHRLTNEGQEKLFTLLDKGYFTRMGEAEKQREVAVRFIFATTENLNEYFLQTFLRRIPVTLELPSLDERSVKEKIELVLSFLLDESKRTDKDFWINYDSLKYLVFREYQGNIGELKAEIQFACAQAYLESTEQQSEGIEIQLPVDSLPKPVVDTKELVAFNELVPIGGIAIDHEHPYTTVQQLLISEMPQRDKFYNYLIKEYSDLEKMNISPKDASRIMQNKIDQLYDMDLFLEDNTTNVVMEAGFIARVEDILTFIEERIGQKIPADLRRMVTTHLLSTLILSQDLSSKVFTKSQGVFSGKIENFDLTDSIVDYASKVLDFPLPRLENVYFDLLIKRMNLLENMYRLDDECGIIVVAHGAATASSMAEYTNLLFSTNIMNSVNMPINKSVDETLTEVRDIVARKNYRKVILMVDIGSLVYFGNVLSEEFQIDVLLISNINLLSLLEVAREVIYESTDFNYLLPVLKEKSHRVTLCKQGDFVRNKLLIISCLTGLGTALKIEKLILDTFPAEMMDGLRIITLEKKELEDINHLHSFAHDDEQLVGIIGTIKVEIPDIPFISLDNLLSNKGIGLVFEMLGYDRKNERHQEMYARVSSKYVQGLSIEAITDLLTVLNPRSISIELTKIYSNICMQTKTKSDPKRLLRFIIHCACMIERLMTSSDYDYASHELSYRDLPDYASVIKMAFRPVEVSYNVVIPPLEVKYVYDLMFQEI